MGSLDGLFTSPGKGRLLRFLSASVEFRVWRLPCFLHFVGRKVWASSIVHVTFRNRRIPWAHIREDRLDYQSYAWSGPMPGPHNVRIGRKPDSRKRAAAQQGHQERQSSFGNSSTEMHLVQNQALSCICPFVQPM